MADQDTAPLTDEERAELEALRAEKAAREEAERARRERAELEALRAEAKAAEQPAAAAEPTPEAVSAPAAAPTPAPAPAAKPAPRTDDRPPVVDPDNLTFGQRMVMTPEETDDDGIPKMPPAQKIIILIGLLCVIGGGAYIWLSNAGLI